MVATAVDQEHRVIRDSRRALESGDAHQHERGAGWPRADLAHGPGRLAEADGAPLADELVVVVLEHQLRAEASALRARRIEEIALPDVGDAEADAADLNGLALEQLEAFAQRSCDSVIVKSVNIARQEAIGSPRRWR